VVPDRLSISPWSASTVTPSGRLTAVFNTPGRHVVKFTLLRRGVYQEAQTSVDVQVGQFDVGYESMWPTTAGVSRSSRSGTVTSQTLKGLGGVGMGPLVHVSSSGRFVEVGYDDSDALAYRSVLEASDGSRRLSGVGSCAFAPDETVAVCSQLADGRPGPAVVVDLSTFTTDALGPVGLPRHVDRRRGTVWMALPDPGVGFVGPFTEFAEYRLADWSLLRRHTYTDGRPNAFGADWIVGKGFFGPGRLVRRSLIDDTVTVLYDVEGAVCAVRRLRPGVWPTSAVQRLVSNLC
jgi:hypothetical protein